MASGTSGKSVSVINRARHRWQPIAAPMAAPWRRTHGAIGCDWYLTPVASHSDAILPSFPYLFAMTDAAGTPVLFTRFC